MDIGTLIRHGVDALGLTVTEQQLNQFHEIIERLEKWNKAYNLTAIRDRHQMVILHLFDSLAIAPYLRPGRLLDVGTGPGFPGIPLAILHPEREYFLLDSNGKKTRYLKQLVYEMRLTQVTVVDTRVEQWQPDRLFDVIVSRAFASLDKMVQLTEHLLADTGVWQAMKGDASLPEQQRLPDNLKVVEVQPLSVPQLDAERHLITIQKKLSDLSESQFR